MRNAVIRKRAGMEAAWNIATTVMKNKEKEIEPFSCIIQWM